jgi:hypothetical protein
MICSFIPDESLVRVIAPSKNSLSLLVLPYMMDDVYLGNPSDFFIFINISSV